jgi:hypothetical protein
LFVPHRLLALVSGLTFGDYLLWNWSLDGSRDVLALVSGLTLPPLAIACLWLLALSIGRLVARFAHRSHVPAGARSTAHRDAERGAGAPPTAPGRADQAPASATTSPAPSSGKLAA